MELLRIVHVCPRNLRVCCAYVLKAHVYDAGTSNVSIKYYRQIIPKMINLSVCPSSISTVSVQQFNCVTVKNVTSSLSQVSCPNAIICKNLGKNKL